MNLARILSVVLVAALAAGCTDQAAPLPAPTPLDVTWTEASLPSTSRTLVRDAISCANTWYVAGATLRPDDTTEPALWSSADGRTWQRVRMSWFSYYGRLNLLYSLACRDGLLAAVGGKPGGAHGYPRVSTWRMVDGVLTEVSASSFELYGGPTANNVGRMIGGPLGFLIVGNRSSGAAVWTSVDASDFVIHEGTPRLASDAAGNTWAHDALAYPGGWILVGGIIRPGHIDRDPMTWTSADGNTWVRHELPADSTYDEIVRLVGFGGDLVGLGVRAGRFRSWHQSGARGDWSVGGDLGASTLPAGFTGPFVGPSVGGVAVTSAGIAAAASNGAVYRLWLSSDGRTWREMAAPTDLPAGAKQYVGLAGAGPRLLLTADGGAGTRIYLTTLTGSPT